jgi:hypothetical protein
VVGLVEGVVVGGLTVAAGVVRLRGVVVVVGLFAGLLTGLAGLFAERSVLPPIIPPPVTPPSCWPRATLALARIKMEHRQMNRRAQGISIDVTPAALIGSAGTARVIYYRTEVACVGMFIGRLFGVRAVEGGCSRPVFIG